MERKYYLRGLGLGIAMTAIIMGVALSGKKTMTDAEIIARAKELGMVENTVLADTSAENVEENTDNNSTEGQNIDGQDAVGGADTSADNDMPEAGEETESGTDVAKEGTAPDTDVDESDDLADGGQEDITRVIDDDKTALEEQENENDEPKEDVNEIITSAAIKTITVSSGDGSYTVAKKLADVGVVTSAETFDTFLCQNGYDKRLRPGTFSIPADASDEQIARIVTGAE